MKPDPIGRRIELALHPGKFIGERAGLAAVEKQVRSRYDAQASADSAAAKPAPGTPLGLDADFEHRRWSAVLRAIYAGQKNVAACGRLPRRPG